MPFNHWDGQWGYLVTVFAVSPWNPGRYPRSSATLSVESTGEKSVACANATRLAGVVAAMAVKLWCVMSGVVVGGFGGVFGVVWTRSRCQSPVFGGTIAG
jgi:hypothetical protein